MNEFVRSVPGIILAGGSSRRFGADKRAAKLDGKPLIAHAFESLSAVANPVYLSVGSAAMASEAEALLKTRDRSRTSGLSIVDVLPDRGPLGGIYAALNLLDADWILVLATDLPRVTPRTLKLLLQEAFGERLAVVSIDHTDRMHPLAGCFNRKLLPYITDTFRGKLYGVRHLLKTVAEERGAESIAHVCVPKAELLNINYPSDLEQEQSPKREE